MKKAVFTLFIAFLLFVPAFVQSEPSYDPVADREAELEQVLQDYRQAVRDGREESKKNRKLLKKCLRLLKEQESASWKGNSGSKIALLFKAGIIVCLYQDYVEPSISYKIAALVCLWLI
jgi:hypothetical protein